MSSLELKYKEHVDQLAQIEALLVEAPDDASLLDLKADIQKYITLFSSQMGEAKQTEYKYGAGDRCMAPWTDGKFYVARVENILEQATDAGDTLVTYLDYGNTEVVHNRLLKVYAHAPAQFLLEGADIKAVNSTDGLFYDANIESIVSPGLYRVSFKKTGKNKKRKKAEVAQHDIVLKVEEKKEEKKVSKKRKQKEPEKTIGDFVIPEHLTPVMTDTDQQKQHKRKMIKRLKQEHRRAVNDHIANKRQGNWLSFQAGLKGKSQSGFMRGKKRKSIWATPDVTTGNEGVTGVNNTLTTFEVRKRPTYQADSESESD
jgi:hypothetical protein